MRRVKVLENKCAFEGRKTTGPISINIGTQIIVVKGNVMR